MTNRDQLLREQFSETSTATSKIDPTANTTDQPRIRADKNAAQKLPTAIKELLRSHISNWSVLDKTKAASYRSGEGIQFFEKTSRGYRKINAYRRNSLCLVSDSWLKRINNPYKTGGASGSAASYAYSGSSADDDPEVVAESYATTETNHQIEFYVANPDGNPMPDAKYSIVINGQTYSGALDENGTGVSDYLSEGDAEITIEPNMENLSDIREAIQKQLDILIEDGIERKEMLNELLTEEGEITAALIVGCIWVNAVWDKGAEITRDSWDMIKGAPDAIGEASSALWQAMQDKNRDGVIDGYAYLAEAAGEVFEDVKRLASVTLALMQDEEFWAMLLDFAERFFDTLSVEDYTKLFAGACFDVATCFLGAAALAKVATTAKTLKSCSGMAAVVQRSQAFAPAVSGIKRIAHIYDLQETPLKRKLKVNKSKHEVKFTQDRSKH
jgi:hypothetical protein